MKRLQAQTVMTACACNRLESCQTVFKSCLEMAWTEKFDVFLCIGYNVFRKKDMITKTKYSANMIEKAGML